MHLTLAPSRRRHGDVDPEGACGRRPGRSCDRWRWHGQVLDARAALAGAIICGALQGGRQDVRAGYQVQLKVDIAWCV